MLLQLEEEASTTNEILNKKRPLKFRQLSVKKYSKPTPNIYSMQHRNKPFEKKNYIDDYLEHPNPPKKRKKTEKKY